MSWASAVDASRAIPVTARALGPSDNGPAPAAANATTENFCHLPGQICDNNGRITHLRLDSQLMNCELPESLSTFTALERLFMFSNEITGTFEQFLGMAKGMKNLNHVHMADMGLHGNLACCESGDSECLSHLKTLDMKRNSLQGDLPECLLDLPKIGVLDLKGNKLTGSMPATLNPNPHMIVLDVREQNGEGMTGPVPDLRPLENLALVGLSGNAFTGAFPALPAKLEAVHISDTKLEGEIHPSANELSKIWVFEAANNGLTGPIPKAFWSSESLKLLDLSDNRLSGSLPEVLKSVNLRVLRLQDNSLTGGIPAGLASLNRLGLLNLTNNGFTGSLNAYSDALSFNTLKVFSVAHNQLTGSIPESMERLGVFSMFPIPGSSNSQVFDVSFNQLDGQFPDHVVATVLRLSSELQSQFEFNIQGNYLACPREEVKTTILKELPDVADATCQEGDKLRTVRSEFVPPAVKELMHERRNPEPVKVEEDAEGEEEMIEEEEEKEEEQAVEEEEEEKEEAVEQEAEKEEEEAVEQEEEKEEAVEQEEEKEETDEQDIEEDRNAADTLSASFSTTISSTASTDQVAAKAEEDDSSKPMSPLLIIIPCAVAGALALIGLAAVFVVRPMVQRRRGEQYRDYDAEAADNPVLSSKAEVSSDQTPPIPTMTEIDNS